MMELMAGPVFKFKSVFKKVAVTAVSFSDFLIFSGIGGDLFVFDSSDGFKLLKTQNILDYHTIHGFVVDEDKKLLCSFGEKCIVISKLEFEAKSLQLECVRKWRVRDWVLSCAWLESSHLAALTAHNQLILFDLKTGSETSVVASTEKCILYCGSIIARGRGWSDVVVIAGTVFQQVIIWSVTDASTTGDRQLLHKLHGHKGAIFSVIFDSRSRQILSTSDDRSVRVWAVKSSGSLLSANDWQRATITLAYSVFGHTSRVWQSYCLQDENIVSIGEDSTLCVWKKGGECESRRETHQGGGVWCMVINEQLGIIVTGGADGGISVWPLESRTNMHRLPAPPEAPRRIELLGSGALLVTTDSGKLLLHSDNSWHTVYSDSKFSNYCLLETSPSRQLVALASIHGDITIFNGSFEKLLEEKISNDRIYSVHWLSDDCILTCHNKGEVHVWKLTKSGALERIQHLSLPVCKERWTTAAVSCNSIVVFGDRMGNLHSAPLLSSTGKEVCTVTRAHSRLGVCSLSVHAGRVWSTGRDGTIKQFSLRDHSLCLVSSSKLPLDWAAQLIHSSYFGLVALCFHETSLVLWSVGERRQLASVQCGGGHRSWSFLLDDDKISFVFLKSKTAHKLECSVDLISRPNILEGFHVREVNCMTRVRGTSDEAVLLSGGEDGSVRLSRYNTAENRWQVCSTEYSHVSSVRSVTSCSLDNQTLVFSAGGRAQIKVWTVHSDNSGSTTLLELSSLMLRDERRGQHWLNSTPVSNPETRYMDLAVAILSNTCLYLLAACSDAFFRIFHFNSATNTLKLHSAVKHSENCLLQVKYVQWPNGRAGAVTAGTDGHLVFWDLDVHSAVTPVWREQVHQSGVNALSTQTLTGDTLLVVTGGDDNMLHVSCYQLTSLPSLAVCKCASWSSSTLHSSVITGVEIVEDLILCCAGDQRVTVLSWLLSVNQLSVQVLDQYCCSVPDIKGLSSYVSLSNTLSICVYGVGAEILELKKEKR